VNRPLQCCSAYKMFRGDQATVTVTTPLWQPSYTGPPGKLSW
jgi:hypothetical protein